MTVHDWSTAARRLTTGRPRRWDGGRHGRETWSGASTAELCLKA